MRSVQRLYVCMEAGTLANVIIERERRITADEELMRDVAEGSERALAELYDRHGRAAYGLAVRILRDASLAEDALQEAFVDVWRSAACFDSNRGSAKSWIMTLTHRRAVDAVRRAKRLRETAAVVTDEPSWSDSTENIASLRTERQAVQHALEQLPPTQRHLLELAYYGGLTQTELARSLELPLGTVKSRTHAALTRLHALLTEEPAHATVHALTGLE